MTKCLAVIFRILSWLCAGVSLLDGGIILFDGITGRLQLQYRITTFIVGLGFCLIGGMIVWLERSLSKIYRHPSNGSLPPELNASWRVVYVALSAVVGVIALVMGLALIGITERMQQGFTIFQ